MFKFSDLGTKVKVIIGVCAPLSLMAALGAASWYSVHQIDQAAHWVDHTHKAIRAANAITASAVDMETGMRGFLLAGKDEFLEPYNDGMARVYKGISDLQQTVSDNPGQVARLGKVEEVLREWQANITEPMIAQRREVGDGFTMDEIAALVGQAGGKAYFDKFRGLIANFIAEEAALMEVRQADNAELVAMADQFILGFIAVATIAGIGFALMIGNGIAGPLVQMTGMMRALANGDTSLEVPGLGRKDEIGKMAEAVEVFKANEIKLGRLSHDLRAGVGRSLEGLVSVCENLKTSADGLAIITEETAANGSNVASAVEQMSASIQTVATGSSQLAGSIGEISEQVTLSSNMARNATDKAGNAKGAVDDLLAEAQEVESVVALISAIAEQTNLLALNATIESARAGDAGKGFAVVAQEVKALASQTSTATGKIAEQIRNIQLRSQSVAAEVTDINDVIANIEEVTTRIASAVTEQDQATSEIASNTDESAKAASEISASIHKVQEQMAVASTTGEQMKQIVKDVGVQSEAIKTALQEFTAEMAA